MTPEELKKYDVVITTYQTVTKEHGDVGDEPVKKKKKVQRGLFDIQWKVRVSCEMKPVDYQALSQCTTSFIANHP